MRLKWKDFLDFDTLCFDEKKKKNLKIERSKFKIISREIC